MENATHTAEIPWWAELDQQMAGGENILRICWIVHRYILGCEIKEGQLYGYQMYGEYSLDTKEDVKSSSACSNICRVTTGCDLWTWTVIPVGQQPAKKCFLKKGRSGGIRLSGFVSGYTFCAP